MSPLSEHRLLFTRLLARHRAQFILVGLCLAIGAILAALDIEGGEFILGWAALIAAVFGLPWFLPPLLTYARSVKLVHIYDEGAGWIVGGREEFHPWEDLREILRRSGEIIIVFKKTPPLVLRDALSGFPQLSALLDAIAAQRLLPVKRQELDDSGAYFGPILLKRQGIRIHDREWKWEEVLEYSLENGWLVIVPTREEEPAESAELAVIPNAIVLLRLLEEMGKRPSSV